MSEQVRDILARVRRQGDAAVRELTTRFGELAPERLRVDPQTLAAASGLLEPPVREALRVATRSIAAVARAEVEAGARPAVATGEQGQAVEVRREPVGAAGIYAPGGTAALASTVLMCCVPARLAGVGRIVVVTPPGATGRPAPAVLAACAAVGVEEVYAIGGAQAIGALAYGTESVPAVDVIAGPGNRYVTEAKRQVYGHVGLDGVIAGPSELMLIGDGTTNPDLAALDLCAQAEHGEGTLLVAASPDAALLDAIAEQAEALAAHRPTVANAPLALVQTPGSSWRSTSPTRSPRSISSWRSRRLTRRPPAAGWPAACSWGRPERQRSATTRPAPTTCSRPAARHASAARSGPGRSCGAPP